MLSEVNIKVKYPTPGPSDNMNRQLKTQENMKISMIAGFRNVYLLGMDDTDLGEPHSATAHD